jgi:hypothetical protein
MKIKYVLAILLAIVLFLLYSRRVSGLTACAPGTYLSGLTGTCLASSSTTKTEVKTKTTRKS